MSCHDHYVCDTNTIKYTKIKKKIRPKKLIIRFSGHFWQKQMRQAGIFFFFFFFTHETGEGTFFLLHEPLKGLVS